MTEKPGLSERRAIHLAGISASVLRYRPRPDRNTTLRSRMLELALEHRRHGYRMIHWLLRNDGWPINLKRLYRLYRQEDLSVRRRRRRKRIAMDRPALSASQHPDPIWSMDFVMDQLADGRRLKCLTVDDDCSKESIAVSVDTSILGAAVARLLETLKSKRSLPQAITTDHGPEFTGKALAQWAYQNGVIQPGKP